jgi:hypothetical protein
MKVEFLEIVIRHAVEAQILGASSGVEMFA